MAYSSPAVTRETHRYSLAGLLNLLVTYVVWGSTYLAIRVAVREGAGWGPFWLGATRVLVASGFLFGFNALRAAKPMGRAPSRPRYSPRSALVAGGRLSGSATTSFLWHSGSIVWAEYPGWDLSHRLIWPKP